MSTKYDQQTRRGDFLIGGGTGRGIRKYPVFYWTPGINYIGYTFFISNQVAKGEGLVLAKKVTL